MPRNPNFTAIGLLKSQSLTTLVRRELERRIVSGEIEPGSKLNEVEIAEELAISRSPVREAFRGLEQDGLVRTEKNRGVSCASSRSAKPTRSTRCAPGSTS
ncbi:MAG TPA: GntR family transcriptional regulator [Usitatibacter sp.]|nr:GntR family transcriptional regulator [Usitatibacter sp.]